MTNLSSFESSSLAAIRVHDPAVRLGLSVPKLTSDPFASPLLTVLLAFEATLWAAAYRTLGALPDGRAALLFSLNAFTSYGHTELHLAPHWRLMGALEGLNGLLLFGLTTAFLYGLIQRVWPAEVREWPRHERREQ